MNDDIIKRLRKAIADPAFCSWSSEEDRQQSTQRLKDLCDQKTIGALIDRLDAAERECERLRGSEDGRYMTVYAFRTDIDEECLGDELDATIDAARAAEQKEGKK